MVRSLYHHKPAKSTPLSVSALTVIMPVIGGQIGRHFRFSKRAGYDPIRKFDEVYDKCFTTVIRNVGIEIGFGI